uniref:C2H2-type domain-containing protein n=1 Tax=Kalanchoe fedtschenkoi TaxID=63787 RepID=A0A7N0UJ73_KALFE
MPIMCSGARTFFKSKSDEPEVHDPKTNGLVATKTFDNKSSKCPCYKWKARFNYRQISKRHGEKLVLTLEAGCAELNIKDAGSNLAVLGTLTPETPSPHRLSHKRLTVRTRMAFNEIDFIKFSCSRCAQQFISSEEVDTHHMSQHAVAELPKGSSTRSVIERICRTSLSESETVDGWIQTVLKVNNLPKAKLQFEDYRHHVQTKASQLSNPHPKLLADGYELMRFYCTTVECYKRAKRYSTSCSSKTCAVCQILRLGFSSAKAADNNNGGQGIITTSSSGRSLQLAAQTDGSQMSRKALILCRVIAGRVHSSSDSHQEQAPPQRTYDSMAKNIGPYNTRVYEELVSLNSKAILPCFVIICKL